MEPKKTKLDESSNKTGKFNFPTHNRGNRPSPQPLGTGNSQNHSENQGNDPSNKDT